MLTALSTCPSTVQWTLTAPNTHSRVLLLVYPQSIVSVPTLLSVSGAIDDRERKRILALIELRDSEREYLSRLDTVQEVCSKSCLHAFMRTRTHAVYTQSVLSCTLDTSSPPSLSHPSPSVSFFLTLQIFFQPLKQSDIVIPPHLSALSTSLQTIIHVNKELLSKIEALVDRSSSALSIGDLFSSMVSLLLFFSPLFSCFLSCLFPVFFQLLLSWVVLRIVY